MKKIIIWLKSISKNPLIQKFYLIAFIAFCIYLIIPKWQISKEGYKVIAVNKFTGEIQGERLRERINSLEDENQSLWNENRRLKEQSNTMSPEANFEIERLKKRVNELLNFINTAHFEKSPNGKFDFNNAISIEPEK